MVKQAVLIFVFVVQAFALEGSVTYDQSLQFLKQIRSAVVNDSVQLDGFFSSDSIKLITIQCDGNNDTVYLHISAGDTMRHFLLNGPFLMSFNFYNMSTSVSAFCYCEGAPSFMKQVTFPQKVHNGIFRLYTKKSTIAECKCDGYSFILKVSKGRIAISEIHSTLSC